MTEGVNGVRPAGSGALRRVRRAAKPLIALAFALAVLAGSWAGYLQITGNVHEVVAGILYRSAQLDDRSLADLIEQHGIRSVVNLTGAHPSAEWYRRERATAASKGAVMVDFSWHVQDELTPDEVDRFLTIARSLPTPILIHCHAGSDRTGLASALYLAGVLKADEETAESQLSFRYGHVALPLTAAWPMDETFEREEPRLGFPGS